MSTTDKYMEVVFADDTNPNAIKEPAKRWRNWGITPIAFVQSPTMIRFKAGDMVPGVNLWPSKEIAEQKATDSDAAWRGPPMKYLGAFPEGERP